MLACYAAPVFAGQSGDVAFLPCFMFGFVAAAMGELRGERL